MVTMTEKDLALIKGLKSGDKQGFEAFFNECGYAINNAHEKLLKPYMEKEELITELYIYLKEKDWHVLNSFTGKNGCQLRTWMTKVAWSFSSKYKKELFPVPIDELQDNVMEKADDTDIYNAMDINQALYYMRRKGNAHKKRAEVLLLKFHYGYDTKDVMQKMNMTRAAYDCCLLKARDEFAALMEIKRKKNKKKNKWIKNIH